MATTAAADGRVERRIENYTKHWQKDTSKESAEHNANRLESYTEVVNGTRVTGPRLALFG
jgi:sterol 24-C-methyltransferase